MYRRRSKVQDCTIKYREKAENSTDKKNRTVQRKNKITVQRKTEKKR